MKKILSISIIILVLLVSCFLIYNHNVKQHYVDAQKKRIELFFQKNLKEYHSLKITGTEKNPMGDYIIRGYVNNNKKLEFEVMMSSDTDYQFEDTITSSKELDTLYKDHKHKKIFPNQIIKEKHLEKKKLRSQTTNVFCTLIL